MRRAAARADLSLEEFVHYYLPKSAPFLKGQPSAQHEAATRAAAAGGGASSSRQLQAAGALSAWQSSLHLGRHHKRHKQVPHSVDWVEAGAVTSIKYQGRVRRLALHE